MLRRFSLLAVLLPTAALGQILMVAQKTTVLSGAAEVITVQQPATGTRLVKFLSAYIDCSVACTVQLERNGTAASSTTLVPLNVNPGESTPVATGWSSSNVGTGSVIQVVSIAAGGDKVFDLTDNNLKPINNFTGQNFTLRTSSISGTVHITILWTEQ